MPGVAGYLMNAGHVSENLESSGDLNRRSQDGVPRAFYVTFCTTQKVTIRSLRREIRGSANLDSARRNGGFARTKLKPFPKEASRFCKPRISAHRQQIRTIQLNPFAALGGYFFRLAAVFPYGNIRGFANLDSAHRSRGAPFHGGNFVLTQRPEYSIIKPSNYR